LERTLTPSCLFYTNGVGILDFVFRGNGWWWQGSLGSLVLVVCRAVGRSVEALVAAVCLLRVASVLGVFVWFSSLLPFCFCFWWGSLVCYQYLPHLLGKVLCLGGLFV